MIRSSSTRNRWLLLLTLLVVACVGIVAVWNQVSQQAKPLTDLANLADTQPIPPIEELTLAMLSTESLVPRNNRPQFAGPQACAECHRQNFEGFMQTKHPFTCREVNSETMPPGFHSGSNQLQSVFPDVRFEMSREGTRFVQSSFQRISGGERKTQSTLDLVLGAGGVADDVFLSWKPDGYLWELPMAWLYPSQEWAASHFDPHTGGEFSRAMTPRCVECHNTWIEHIPGTINQYNRNDAILGVTCEVCHGPADQHVDYHRTNPAQPSGQQIVAATKLPRERHIEVCTQCHSNAMRPKGPPFSYRPGTPLEDSFKVLPTLATEDDRVANQISYLRQSKCFIASENMTCVTCHNPHQAHDASKSGSASCKACHTQAVCQSSDQFPAEARHDCVACHMPSYLKININFQTADDNYVPPIRRTEHRIAVHQHATKETLLRHFEKRSDETSQLQVRKLTDELVQHFEAEADRCQQQYRFLATIAARREVLRIQETPDAREKLRSAVKLHEDQENKFSAAMKQIRDGNQKQGISLFEEILKVNPRDSKAHGRLGTEYAKAGDIARAVHHLEQVALIDPNDSYGFSMLGWIAYLEGRLDASLEYYAKAEELEPGEAKIKYQKSLVLIRSGRSAEAIQCLQKVLEIEPLHADALPTLVQGLLSTGQAEQAIAYAERAARATNLGDLNILLMLAEVYASARLNDKALSAYQRLITLAKVQDPARVPQLKNAMLRLAK